MEPKNKKSKSTSPPILSVDEQGPENKNTVPPPELADAGSTVNKMSATIDNLSARVLEQAELAREQVEKNMVDHGLLRLQQAVEQLQALARVSTGTAVVPGLANEVNAGGRTCGCGEKPPTCCIQLYISRVRVAESQGLLEGDLELIFAVRALDQCGLLPSLSSYMSIAQFGGNWVPAFAPIGKFCVPCNGTLVVPIVAEALETGGLFEGKPERGSAQSQIALRCSCDVVPIVLTIILGGTLGATVNPKKGKVEVEVSGRLSEGCCC